MRAVEAEGPTTELGTLAKVLEAPGLAFKQAAGEGRGPRGRHVLHLSQPRRPWQSVPSDGCFLVRGSALEKGLSPQGDRVDHRADQVNSQDLGAATPRLPMHSSRETEAARYDHRQARDRAHPVTSIYGTTSGSRTRGRPFSRCLSQAGHEVTDPSGGP